MRQAHNENSIEGAAGQPGCSPETNLWLAVVQEVISTESADVARKSLRSNDGQTVAAMAGLEADWIADRILPEVGVQWREGKRRYARQHFVATRRAAEAAQDRFRPITW